MGFHRSALHPFSLLVLLAVLPLICKAQLPPSLASLGFQKQQVEPSLDLPVISNFHGSVAIGSDLLSMAALVAPPLSMGYNLTSPLRVILANGTQSIASANQVLFSPHTGYRYGDCGSSAARLVFEQNLVLIQVNLQSQVMSASTDLWAMLRFYPPADWTWIYPAPLFPPHPGDYQSYLTGSAPNQMLVVKDTQSVACGVFFSPFANYTTGVYPQTAYWNFTGEGESREIQLAYAFAQNCSAALSLVQSVVDPIGFESVWNATEAQWEARWQQAFTPNNTHYSGYLPVLETSDVDIARAYYVSVLTILSLERTSFPLMSRAYITAHGGPYPTPQAPLFIGATTVFVWDESFESVTLAMLDPEWVRNFIKLIIANINPATTFGVDLLSGEPTGYFYAATFSTLYSVIDGYVRVTGDTAFLLSNVTVYGSKSAPIPLIEYMTTVLAMNSLRYPCVAPGLADYGPDPNTFLECVPDYIHTTPSLSATNIWMFIRSASWLSLLNNTLPNITSQQLLSMAETGFNALIPQLYVGDGVWGCKYPNGSLITVRHVIDFVYISNMIGELLPDTVAAEMAEFVQRELIVPQWMRALSLSDLIAPVSRPDHGSDGAYPAWPAMTVTGLAMASASRQGNWSLAADYLRSVSQTMLQGPIGQANQLPGTPGGESYSVPFKTQLGYTRYTALAGGSFADLVLTQFFGVYSFQSGDATTPVLYLSNQPRAFDGIMHNVPRYGDVISNAKQGLSIGHQYYVLNSR